MEAQTLMVSFYFSDHFPALSWVDRLSGLSRRLHNNFKDSDAFYQQLIDEHLHPSTPTPDRQDIIDLMIQLKHSSSSTSYPITDHHIKALLMNLFVAGTDTVAAAIVWTMTALMLRPTIMNKAQMEIRKVGRSVVDEEDMKKLPYLKAVVLEALRLYPPAPLLYRTHQEATPVLELEGYNIEAGTRVIINGWAIGRDPEIWKDADEFHPERFMSDDDSSCGSNHGYYFEMMTPFGGGRRRCPGMDMGLTSIHLALANLLYSFDWALPPASGEVLDTDALPGLTMHKKNALLLLPTPYHASSSSA